MANNTILKMDNITKYIYDSYGKPIKGTSVKILDNVHFDIKESEVHILIGENGAGKSTLMKILGGIIPQDEGTIELSGRNMRFSNPKESREAGIGFIHQELNLCPNLDVAENLFLGNEIKGKVFTNKKEMYKKSEEMLAMLGFNINTKTLVGELSTAQQQIVEIVKAVSYNSKIIIMDEPTASLTQKEIEHLFSIIKDMTKKGMSIIYISHRFEELKEVGDRISVLRDGTYVGTMDMSDFTYDKAISMMVGRTLESMYSCSHKVSSEEALRVENMKISSKTEPFSFTIKKGEIVGIGGLVGSGRTELAKSIFGARDFFGGSIIFKGKNIKKPSPSKMIKNKIVYLTEDRKIEGLVLKMSIRENITLTVLRKIFKSSFINKKKEDLLAEKMADDLKIVMTSVKQIANTLSGGNQQKVVFAKWIAAKPDVLILDEPTRGIDVNAKYEIYKIIDRLASEGAAVIMISSELPELIGMSDRIYVMRRGTISKELTDKKDFTQEKILSYTI